MGMMFAPNGCRTGKLATAATVNAEKSIAAWFAWNKVFIASITSYIPYIHASTWAVGSQRYRKCYNVKQREPC
jgi:hypothetical protein